MSDTATDATRIQRPSAAAIATTVAAAFLLAGCFGGGTRVQAPPLPATPAQPVETRELPPVEPLPADEEPLEEETRIAALPDETTALEVSESDLVGGWALTSGGETCQLFMTLTRWEGGNRASTRGCGNETLAAVSAWELSGKTITLKDGEGATVATVLATAPQTFNGRSAEGLAVTVAR